MQNLLYMQRPWGALFVHACQLCKCLYAKQYAIIATAHLLQGVGTVTVTSHCTAATCFSQLMLSDVHAVRADKCNMLQQLQGQPVQWYS